MPGSQAEVAGLYRRHAARVLRWVRRFERPAFTSALRRKAHKEIVRIAEDEKEADENVRKMAKETVRILNQLPPPP